MTIPKNYMYSNSLHKAAQDMTELYMLSYFTHLGSVLVRPGRWHSIGAHVKPLKMFFQSVELAQYGNNACGICGTVFLKA
jgi:hypothetical protein